MSGSRITEMAPAGLRGAMAVTLAALAIRLVVLIFWTPGDLVFSDMGNYDRIANDLVNATVRVNHTFVPIGYPAFLAVLYAIVGRNFLIVGIVQALLGALTCLLAWDLARRFGASARWALGGAMAVAVYPPLIYYGAFLLTEAVAPFFLALAVWLLLRAVDRGGEWLSLVQAGVSLALATLIRTNFLVVYPFLALVAWVACRPDMRLGLRVAVGVLLCALPLLALSSAHNSRLLGRPAGLSSNGGMNFFLLQADYQRFNSPDSSWSPIRNGLSYGTTYESPVLSHNEAYLYRQGWWWLVNRPNKARHLLRNLAEGAGLGLQGYWPANRLRPEHPSEQTWLRLLMRWCSRAFFLLVLVVVAACVVAAVRGRLLQPLNVGLLLSLGLVFGMVVTWTVFLADPRMHVPFDPLLIATACAIPVAFRPR